MALVDLVHPALFLGHRVSRIGAAPDLIPRLFIQPQRRLKLSQSRQDLRFFPVGGRKRVTLRVPLLFEVNATIYGLQRILSAPDDIQLVRQVVQNRGPLLFERALTERAHSNAMLCFFQETKAAFVDRYRLFSQPHGVFSLSL